MSQTVYLGIDIGSSSVRTAAFDEKGVVLGLYQKPVTLLSRVPGEAVLDADEVLETLADTLAECNAHFPRVRAAGFDAIMHSILPLDASGRPLTPVLTWGDTRAQAQAQRLARHPQCEAWSRRTGCHLASPIYPAAKILYLQENFPEEMKRCHKLVTLKQYITMQLFGCDWADWSDAASTGLFNLFTHDWDEEILRELGIERCLLCDTAAPDQVLPQMLPSWCERTGLSSDTLFVLGTTDGVAANTGCGVFDDSAMSCTIGTSGALRTCLSEIPPFAGQELWCYSYLPGVEVTGAAISNGGIVLQQIRKLTGLSYREMDDRAARIAPGSEGLTFIPTFLGERSPDYNARVSGSIMGMGLHHDAGHLARAAMEGVLFRLYDNDRILREKAPRIQTILANGGYAKSPVWLQMQSDLFGRPIAVAGAPEAASLGAAYLSMMAAGDMEYGQYLPAMTPGKAFTPDPSAHEAFQEAYHRYRQLYHHLFGGNE